MRFTQLLCFRNILTKFTICTLKISNILNYKRYFFLSSGTSFCNWPSILEILALAKSGFSVEGLFRSSLLQSTNSLNLSNLFNFWIRFNSTSLGVLRDQFCWGRRRILEHLIVPNVAHKFYDDHPFVFRFSLLVFAWIELHCEWNYIILREFVNKFYTKWKCKWKFEMKMKWMKCIVLYYMWKCKITICWWQK